MRWTWEPAEVRRAGVLSGRRRGRNRLTGWISQLLGGALVLAVLAEVFFTVLCARSGTSRISERIASVTWALLRGALEDLPLFHSTDLHR